MVSDMPIIRPGTVDTGTTDYESYLEGTETYRQQYEGGVGSALEKSRKQSQNIIRKPGYVNPTQANLEGKYIKEASGLYNTQARELMGIDTREYQEAELSRPVFDRTGTKTGSNVYTSGESYNKALSEWTDKYKNVLGRGDTRYQAESTFLTGAQETAEREQVVDEFAPYSLGKPISQLLSNTTDYEVKETYSSGAPKLIAAKPKEYTSMVDFGGGKTQSTYNPYEVLLSETGVPLKEVSRDVRTDMTNWQSGWGTRTTYSPYEKAILEYDQTGIPTKLQTYLGYQTGSSGSRGWSYGSYGVRPEKIVEISSGKLASKEVYDEGLQGFEAKGQYGSEYSYTPFLKESYDYNQNLKTEFPKPLEQIRSGAYKAPTTVQTSNVKRQEPTTFTLYNPYTGKGYTTSGRERSFFQTAPQLSTVKGPTMGVSFLQNQNVPKLNQLGNRTNVIQNPLNANRWINWSTNPVTGSPFRSQNELDSFWQERNYRAGSTIMDQQLMANLMGAGGTIPAKYRGKTSKEFGQVSMTGEIQRTPANIYFNDVFG